MGVCVGAVQARSAVLDLLVSGATASDVPAAWTFFDPPAIIRCAGIPHTWVRVCVCRYAHILGLCVCVCVYVCVCVCVCMHMEV